MNPVLILMIGFAAFLIIKLTMKKVRKDDGVNGSSRAGDQADENPEMKGLD